MPCAQHPTLPACLLAAGTAPAWLRCPSPPRTFLLELLEFVLSFRPQPFHSLPQFSALLHSRVCPILEGLVRQGLQAGADATEMGDVRLVLKAVGGLTRKHAQLVPAQAAVLLQMVLKGCSSGRVPWQRIACLQALKALVADHLLVYQLFEMYDCSMEHDLNAMQVGTLRAAAPGTPAGRHRMIHPAPAITSMLVNTVMTPLPAPFA